MKRTILLIALIFLFAGINAQVTKTINIEVPGQLSSLLTMDELLNVNQLTVTGTINKSDLDMMNYMPKLDSIDISETIVVGNEIPDGTFAGNSHLRFIFLPGSINKIGSSFQSCIALTDFRIKSPSALTSFSSMTFYNCNSLVSFTIPSSVIEINGPVFNSCENLSEIKFEEPVSITTISGNPFFGCTGLKNFTIPKTVTNLTNAFYSCYGLETVEFEQPSSITNLGVSAFAHSGIKSITIPVSITNIEGSAFSDCPRLETITIPKTVSSVGNFTFQNCVSLKTVNFELPASITTIGMSTFVGCTALESIEIPGSVTTIENYAFNGCTSLASVSIPASLKNLGSMNFSGSKAVFNVDANNPTFVGVNGMLRSKNGGYLFVCTNYFSGSFSIPDNIMIIGSNAFYGCTMIDSINIPTSIYKIWDFGFSNCSGLKSISVQHSTPLNIAATVFEGIDKTTCKLYVPAGSLDLYRNATGWKEFQNIIAPGEITVNVETPGTLSSLLTPDLRNSTIVLTLTGTIDARDFRIMRDSMPNLELLDMSGVTIVSYEGTDGTYTPNHATYPDNEIPQYAFLSKTTLTNIKLPVSVISIGKWAFSGCKFSTIQLPQGLTNIDERAFNLCNMLISIDIPSSVYKVGIYAFMNCTSLQSANIGAATIDMNGFRNCTNLNNIQLQETVMVINSLAFSTCPALTQITIPASVHFIQEGVFSNSPTMVTVSPASEYFMSENGILYDKEKTILYHHPKTLSGSFVIPETVVKVMDYAFLNCSLLTSIEMSPLTEYIGNNAFGSCTGLSSIVIPEKVSFIGNTAFANCTGLNTIYAKPLVPFDFANIVNPFLNVNKTNCKLIVPQKSLEDYRNTVYWKDFNQIVASNLAPVANAGLDITVDENSVVILDGSGSSDFEGDSLSFLWTAPAGIFLSSESAVKPEFIAPEVKNDTVIMFSLIVNDCFTNSQPDTVGITIKQVNKMPVADAGPDITISELLSIEINGSGSFDADNDELSYRWIVPEGLISGLTNHEQLNFFPSEVKNDTTLMIQLIVNDGIIDSNPDSVFVTVINTNKTPVAIAGNDQTVNENTAVTLDGSDSFDPDEDLLSYQWISPSGINLSSENVSNPTFTTPEVNNDSVLFFILTVSDGIEVSKPDTVFVNIKQVNKVPVANAGPDIIADENSIVQLDGSGSYDADNDSLLFNWVSPAGILLNQTTVVSPMFTAPEVKNDTLFIFILTVSDGLSSSIPDTVSVFINNINQAPVANAGSNQTATGNSVITLDGIQSFDPDGDSISFIWSAPIGIELSSDNTPSVSATMPDVETPTDFIFGLVVTDGLLFSELVEVIITVVPQTAEVILSAVLNGDAIPASSVNYDFYIEKDGNYEWQEISQNPEGFVTKFNLKKGKWIALASPVSEDLLFIPTYFGDKINWSEAQFIEITDYSTFSGIVNCQPADTVEEAGNFTIEGYITQISGNKGGLYLNQNLEGTPLSGIVIYLFQEGKQVPAFFAITDVNGYYEFSNIPKGNYSISVELPGYESEKKFDVIIENNSPQVMEMNFNVVEGTGVITNIHEFEIKVHFYPNPFNNEIRMISSFDARRIIIRNSLGQIVEIINNPTSFIHTDAFKPGIYFISVYDMNERLISTEKLIKQ